jgi:hypothetical protein
MQKLFERQPYHLIALALLLGGVYLTARSGRSGFVSGFDLGHSTRFWLWLSIAVPILHQVYVWLAWRLQLYYGLLEKWLGERAFAVYAAGFTLFLIARAFTIIELANSNAYTLPISPILGYSLALVCALLAGYTGYSVLRYFGFRRVAGIDHFDKSYRKKPLVRQGVFRWTSNGMYTFGFLAAWIPGLMWLSQAALLSALFSHLYIWVHYFCTELPDMRQIYRPGKRTKA